MTRPENLSLQMLSHELHDALAAFYIDMDGLMRGGGAALNLPGLSLLAETRIRMQVGAGLSSLACTNF